MFIICFFYDVYVQTVYSVPVYVCLDQKSKMAATAGLSLTWEPIGHMFKSLLRRRFKKTSYQTIEIVVLNEMIYCIFYSLQNLYTGIFKFWTVRDVLAAYDQWSVVCKVQSVYTRKVPTHRIVIII